MELVSGILLDWVVRPSLRLEVCLNVFVDDIEDKIEGDLELIIGPTSREVAELIRALVVAVEGRPVIALDLLSILVVAGGIRDAIWDILEGIFTDVAGSKDPTATLVPLDDT